MAAGQQKKRLNSPSYVTCNFQEQYRLKKKKNLGPSQNALNMRGHISLEWDETQKRAVAKREQIGITWRDMAPFIGSVPQSHMDLADVFPIPQEIFELENLKEVLSYEVILVFIVFIYLHVLTALVVETSSLYLIQFLHFV